MTMRRLGLWVAGWVVGLGLAQIAASEEAGFVPLFNGKDLSGWVRVNCAPQTFTVRDGLIHCTGVPTGVLRSDKQYENFILEIEWRHMRPRGNAGLFVWSGPIPTPGCPFTRSIEIQILDGRNTENYTSHGDIFSIHGSTMKPDRPHPNGWARCLPSERRCKPAGQWNHYRLVCNDGTIKLAVNGKVVSGARECNYRKGYICLESEGSEVHFRNIRIKELPSTNPKPEAVAKTAQGFVPLYTGINLAGWKSEPGHKGHWRPRNWSLDYDGKSEARDKNLWTEKEYGNFILICDCRWRGKRAGAGLPVVLASGTPDVGEEKIAKHIRKGRWNRFLVTVKGGRLAVELNGKLVIQDAPLRGGPARGRIALRHADSPVQFANVFIKELD
jgi:hypothetical protein